MSITGGSQKIHICGNVCGMIPMICWIAKIWREGVEFSLIRVLLLRCSPIWHGPHHSLFYNTCLLLKFLLLFSPCWHVSIKFFISQHPRGDRNFPQGYMTSLTTIAEPVLDSYLLCYFSQCISPSIAMSQVWVRTPGSVAIFVTSGSSLNINSLFSPKAVQTSP
jgi:hypothetical protein